MTTTDHTDRKAKMLERVRALLAKADGTNFPEEADTFRAKAHALMAQYAIQEWQLDAGTADTSGRQPIVRAMDFSWWVDQAPQRENLWTMLYDVAEHCRCVVALRGYGTREHGAGDYRTIPVIGLPSDLDYMDMLFTSLMVQLADTMHPKVDVRQTLGENALRMRKAGKSMREGRDAMAPSLWAASMLPLTDAQRAKFPYVNEGTLGEERTHWRDLPSALQKSLVGRVRRAINDEAEKQGVNISNVHPRVFHRSFAAGFVSEIGQRFAHMRRTYEQDTGGSTGSTALVLRDIYRVSQDMYDELWPRQPITTSGRRGRAVTRDLKFSHDAYGTGREAGAKADIHQHPSKGLRTRKEITE